MRDPVAEILEERAGTSNGLAGAIALSLVLHAGGSAIAVFTAMRQAPPRPVTTLNIRFAQAARPVAPAAARAPVEAPTQPVAPRIEEPRAKPAKQAKKPAEAPRKDTVPISPFGRSTKKGAEAPAPPPPSPPQSAQATSTAGSAIGGAIGIGEAGVTGLEGGDFPYTLYLERMKSLIGSRWIRPPVTAGPATIIHFRIDRDGTIRDARIETASGVGQFDRAALRAVLEASPLPSLPFGYSGNYLGVHLTFR